MEAVVEQTDQATMPPYAIIAGFGIPGREVANLLEAMGIPFRVVELNAQTVSRCAQAGLEIIEGDIRSEQTLRRAGIERATFLALAIPDDPAVLETISLAKRLNPACKVLARCRRVSAAFEANRRGADAVVSEEQVVGAEFRKLAAPMVDR